MGVWANANGMPSEDAAKLGAITALGSWAGNQAGAWSGSLVVSGAVSGAVTGGGYAYLNGDNVRRGMVQGALRGAATVLVMMGISEAIAAMQPEGVLDESISEPKASEIKDEVTANPALRDNVLILDTTITYTMGGKDYTQHHTLIHIYGKVAMGNSWKWLYGGKFNRAVDNIRQLNGVTAAEGNSTYQLAVNLEVIADKSLADWVINVSGQKNSATPGRSGIDFPIRLGTIRQWTGAHEFLHTFGLWHQWNSTSAITSYNFDQMGGADYRSLTFSEASRFANAYR
jgi:hypothetical protein